jgi:hypothetical protein
MSWIYILFNSQTGAIGATVSITHHKPRITNLAPLTQKGKKKPPVDWWFWIYERRGNLLRLQ